MTELCFRTPPGLSEISPDWLKGGREGDAGVTVSRPPRPGVASGVSPLAVALMNHSKV